MGCKPISTESTIEVGQPCAPHATVFGAYAAFCIALSSINTRLNLGNREILGEGVAAIIWASIRQHIL